MFVKSGADEAPEMEACRAIEGSDWDPSALRLATIWPP
jgi:hypothetical protein